MHIPIPGVIDDPSVRLHQSRNDPFYGPARIFAPQIESANQMEQVVREKAHLQPDFVRHEAVATRFVPAQRVLACLDPVTTPEQVLIFRFDLKPEKSISCGPAFISEMHDVFHFDKSNTVATYFQTKFDNIKQFQTASYRNFEG